MQITNEIGPRCITSLFSELIMSRKTVLLNFGYYFNVTFLTLATYNLSINISTPKEFLTLLDVQQSNVSICLQAGAGGKG